MTENTMKEFGDGKYIDLSGNVCKWMSFFHLGTDVYFGTCGIVTYTFSKNEKLCPCCGRKINLINKGE